MTAIDRIMREHALQAVDIESITGAAKDCGAGDITGAIPAQQKR